MFLKIENEKVVDIISEFNPAFPGIPVSLRYPSEYILALKQVPDDTSVNTGWKVKGDKFEPVPQEDEPPNQMPPNPTVGEELKILREQNAALSEQNDMLTSTIDAILTILPTLMD